MVSNSLPEKDICEICNKPIKMGATYVRLNDERTRKAHIHCYRDVYMKKIGEAKL